MTTAISAGPMKAVARPESAKRPKACAGGDPALGLMDEEGARGRLQRAGGGAEEAARRP